MANIAKKSAATLAEGVRLVLNNYNRVVQYHQRNINTEIDNYRFYYSKNPELGLGQYSQEAVAKLTKQGRQLIQYNITMPTIDTVVATLVQSKMIPDFVAVDDVSSTLSDALGRMAISDRELMNWDAAIGDLTLAGTLHQGVIKMGISTKWSPLGNISMESMLPGSTLPDPTWRTQLSSDCKHVWHDGWYTAEQIAAIFGKKTAQIMDAARRVEKDGMEYGENTGAVPYRGFQNTQWGSLFKVIEQYDVKETIRKQAYLLRPNGRVKIPVSDMEAAAWLNAKYPDWQPFDIIESEEIDRICYIKSICPTLLSEEYLEDGKTEFQCQATPFKFWSASRLNGEPRGLIESIKDAQTYINYWSGMLTFKMQAEGGGGAQYVDPAMFESYAEFERYCNNRNNPTENFKLKPGYMEKGVLPARPVVNSGFPNELYKNLEYIVDKMLPHISKVTPALSGFSEASNESGYLYRQKKMQSDLQTFTIHNGYKNFWNDVYESYFLGAPDVYSNEGVERCFSCEGGKERIRVNEVVETEDGEYGIKNDVSKLKDIRHKVIITERADSPTEKANNLLLYSDMLKSIAQFPQKQTTAGVVLGLLIENVDGIPTEKRDTLLNVNKLETELEILRLETNITAQKAAKKQAESALNPPPPPPPPPPADPQTMLNQVAMLTGAKVSLSMGADGKAMQEQQVMQQAAYDAQQPTAPTVSGPVEEMPVVNNGQVPEQASSEPIEQGLPQ